MAAIAFDPARVAKRVVQSPSTKPQIKEQIPCAIKKEINFDSVHPTATYTPRHKQKGCKVQQPQRSEGFLTAQAKSKDKPQLTTNHASSSKGLTTKSMQDKATAKSPSPPPPPPTPPQQVRPQMVQPQHHPSRPPRERSPPRRERSPQRNRPHHPPPSSRKERSRSPLPMRPKRMRSRSPSSSRSRSPLPRQTSDRSLPQVGTEEMMRMMSILAQQVVKEQAKKRSRER